MDQENRITCKRGLGTTLYFWASVTLVNHRDIVDRHGTMSDAIVKPSLGPVPL